MLNAGCLTVKHIERGGAQSITQAMSVSFNPEGPELTAYGVPLPVSDGCSRYADGTVYVMNEAGATVAKYELN